MLTFCILGLLSTALAATTTTCQTVSTSTSTSRVKTYWNTETTTETKSITSVYQDTVTTSQPDKTVTSQNTIYTIVGTKTVGGAVVSAASTTTSTSQIWTTVTATTSTVSTSTSTITYPTSTISPSPDFTPIADYLNSQGHVATRVNSDPKKRGISFGDAVAVEERQAATQYPVFVLCDKYIGSTTSTTVTSTKTPPKTLTLSRSTTTVTAADATKKVKSTVSAGSTTTYTTTTTIVTARTMTMTSFSLIYTATTTRTREMPQSTYYAACAPNNIIDTVDGGAIESFQGYTYGIGFTLYQGVPAPKTAYECCVACLTMDPSCALSWWSTNPNPGCLYLPDNGTCAGDSQQAWFKTTPGDPPDMTISNTNCASWNYLGTT